MKSYEFNSDIQDGIIHIPEKYKDKLSPMVKVILYSNKPKQSSQQKVWQDFFDTVNASDEKTPVKFPRFNLIHKLDI